MESQRALDEFRQRLRSIDQRYRPIRAQLATRVREAAARAGAERQRLDTALSRAAASSERADSRRIPEPRPTHPSPNPHISTYTSFGVGGHFGI
ncbi:hypothetical protein ACWFRF_04465 [Nocardia sp. NPDC055165]|uniref:hypothetical protein n=1 Tax=Nocardia sp. NPDC060220 TaxID=3347076 RepID=UPI00364FC5E3